MRSAVNANYPRPTSTSHVCGGCNSLIPAAAADNSLTMELLRCVAFIEFDVVPYMYAIYFFPLLATVVVNDGWMVDG